MNLAFSASSLIGSRVLIIGDVMLDQYQRGVVERISPEAPVPIVKIVEQDFKVGGAGNVAQNIALLGGKATLVGICGQDTYGENLQHICAEMKIDCSLVFSPSRETTLKSRIMAAHQQMLRVDRESNAPLDAAERKALCQMVESRLDDFDVVILSDYGKGVISQEFLEWFRERKKENHKILLDPKTCNFPFYSGLYCMTPNMKEASEGLDISITTKGEIIQAGKRLVQERNLGALVITLGAEGMAIFLPGTGVYHLSTTAQKVFDVTGAGDTVIAVIGLGIASGLDLLTSSILANCSAGLVVGQVGAVGISQEELTAALGVWSAVQYEQWDTM